MSDILTKPSHVAILVRSVDRTAKVLRGFDYQIEKAEVWDGEGTKEIYIEKNKGNSLLMMEPTKPGAYQQAMEKRGPSLHHLAIDVLNLEEFLLSIAGSGWLLHPSSIKMMKQSQTAYLARPGFPALIEVQEKKELKNELLFVTKIELPFDGAMASLVSAIGLAEIVVPTTEAAAISFGENRISLAALLHSGEKGK